MRVWVLLTNLTVVVTAGHKSKQYNTVWHRGRHAVQPWA